mgnify:CR=1 FL=1
MLQTSNVISLMLYLSRKYKDLIFEVDHFKFRVTYVSKNRCDVLNKGGVRVFEYYETFHVRFIKLMLFFTVSGDFIIFFQLVV